MRGSQVWGTEMTQLERIEHFEKIFDETSAAVDNLSVALENYAAAQKKYSELLAYYGGDWLRDYDDDEAGKLPKDLKRGVLSQDGVYDLLTKNRELQARMLEVLSEIVRNR